MFDVLFVTTNLVLEGMCIPLLVKSGGGGAVEVSWSSIDSQLFCRSRLCF
jgi:hypothetical protein